MQGIGVLRTKIIEILKGSYSRKGSEIAGSLVYFIILGLVPFSFCLMMLLNLFSVDLARVLNINESSRYYGVIGELLSAGAANVGASVVFVLFALFSSVKLFYHLLRCGEILYDYSRNNTRIIDYLLSFLAMLAVLILLFSAAVFSAVSEKLFTIFEVGLFGKCISAVSLIALLFALTFVLNIFISPNRLGAKKVIWGSLFTVVWFFAAGWIFGIYIDNFGSFDKLYGKLAFVVIFIFFLYVLCYGFVLGVIFNIKMRNRVKTAKKSDNSIDQML